MISKTNETAREALLRLGFTTDPRNPDRYYTGTLHPLHSLLPDVYLREELGLLVRGRVDYWGSDDARLSKCSIRASMSSSSSSETAPRSGWAIRFLISLTF